jgi:hypothetical protein
VHLNFPESVPSFASVFRHFGCCAAAAATLLFVLSLHSALCALFLSLARARSQLLWSEMQKLQKAPLRCVRAAVQRSGESENGPFSLYCCCWRAKKTKVSVRSVHRAAACVGVLNIHHPIQNGNKVHIIHGRAGRRGNLK